MTNLQIAEKIELALNMLRTGKRISANDVLTDVVSELKTGEVTITNENSRHFSEGYFGDELRDHFNAERQIKMQLRDLWERMLKSVNTIVNICCEYNLNVEWARVDNQDDYVTNIKNVLKVLNATYPDTYKSCSTVDSVVIARAVKRIFDDVAATDRKCVELANHQDYGVNT